MKILYFAWVRDKIGLDSEEFDLPSEIVTAGEFIKWFKTRGDAYAEVIGASDTVKMAINQEYAGPENAISNEDEVALFPPVTGGKY
jgi:molybdopterin converting factor subunit 1